MCYHKGPKSNTEIRIFLFRIQFMPVAYTVQYTFHIKNACKNVHILAQMLIFLKRNVKLLMRYGNPKSDPRAVTLSERFYIYHSNPLFIRQHAKLIMCANENVCVCHLGYLAFSALLFLRRSHSIISWGNPPNHGQDCVGK